MCTKKFIFEILINVVVKIAEMEKALLMIQLLCVMKLWKQQMFYGKNCGSIKSIPKTLNKKKVICTMRRFYILLAFY